MLSQFQTWESFAFSSESRLPIEQAYPGQKAEYAKNVAALLNPDFVESFGPLHMLQVVRRDLPLCFLLSGLNNLSNVSD